MSFTSESHFVDLTFNIQGEHVPVDHGYALYSAIAHVLESTHEHTDAWLHNSNVVGLLPIRGRYAGSGTLLLNNYANFGLRLPAAMIPRVLRLAGQRLNIQGCMVRVGVSKTSALIPAPVLYAHIVTTKNGEDEIRFDAEVQRQLNVLDIKGKPMRGQRRIVTIKDKKVVGYTLLVSELTAEESIRLQEQGLGGRRKMGCGVFVAHKDSE